LREVQRLDPTPFSGYDYYVLSDADPYSPKREGLDVMFRDPDVGVMFARTTALHSARQ